MRAGLRDLAPSQDADRRKSCVLGHQPFQELLHFRPLLPDVGECRRLSHAGPTVASDPGGIEANLFGVDRLVEDVGNELVRGLSIVPVVIAAQCKFIA